MLNKKLIVQTVLCFVVMFFFLPLGIILLVVLFRERVSLSTFSLQEGKRTVEDVLKEIFAEKDATNPPADRRTPPPTGRPPQRSTPPASQVQRPTPPRVSTSGTSAPSRTSSSSSKPSQGMADRSNTPSHDMADRAKQPRDFASDKPKGHGHADDPFADCVSYNSDFQEEYYRRRDQDKEFSPWDLPPEKAPWE